MLKPANGLGGIGSEFQVLQSAGEIDTGDKIIRVDGGYRKFAKAEQYILFIDWNVYLAQYELAYGPFAIFRLQNGRIDTPAKFGPGAKAQGKLGTEFLAELRSLKHRAEKPPAPAAASRRF